MRAVHARLALPHAATGTAWLARGHIAQARRTQQYAQVGLLYSEGCRHLPLLLCQKSEERHAHHSARPARNTKASIARTAVRCAPAARRQCFFRYHFRNAQPAGANIKVQRRHWWHDTRRPPGIRPGAAARYYVQPTLKGLLWQVRRAEQRRRRDARRESAHPRPPPNRYRR